MKWMPKYDRRAGSAKSYNPPLKKSVKLIMPSPSSLTTGQRLALGFGLVLALIIGITAFGIQKVKPYRPHPD
jgi:hypothetical protein